MTTENRKWLAQWIWNDGEKSPRNEWWCFRRSFELPEEGLLDAKLHITADSRYVVYVNGEPIGRGPVRSWPFELFYDTYSIERWLKPGQTNTVAVLVLHFGITNFYYLRGRGGLLAELELADGTQTRTIATDAEWKVSRYLGQDSRSPRMACQQGFAEQIDAREWTPDWILPGYSDADWRQATVVGPVGMEPWASLTPRDIPFLTEESIQPVRVEQLGKVKPIAYSTSIDMRNHMVPESANHANRQGYVGYVATVIRLFEDGKLTLGFPNASVNFGNCRINDTVYTPEQFYGIQPERYLDLELPAGDHFLLLDVTCIEHGHGFHMGIDCDARFELLSPIAQAPGDTPFITLGPFDQFTYIDHQPERELKVDSPEYKACAGISRPEHLGAWGRWIRPIPETLVSRHDILTLCTWKSEECVPVPEAMQSIVMPNGISAEVPNFEDGDTEFILDFGKEWSGYISFDIDAQEGTILDFYGFEYMRDGWRQDTYGLDNTFRYTAREGCQAYTSPVRRGFRYLMVTVRNAERPVKVNRIHVSQSNYPVAEVGRFHCSDYKLNQIWEISRHTTRLCMEDTFVDCPAYEQVFWVGDSRNEALVNYYVFGAGDIVKRCLNLVPSSKFQTPLYVDQVPSGWNSVIPNWTFFWAIACREYYMQTADLAFLTGIWPHMSFTLDHYLEHLDERGLLFIKCWSLLDWAPMDSPWNGIVTHQNLFLLKTLSAAADAADIVGDGAKAAHYRQAAERLKAAINKYLWSDECSAYLDCIHADGRRSSIFSMQTQVCAYLCGAAQGERLGRLEELLLHPPEGFVQIGSPFMSFFYYEALAGLRKTSFILEDIRKNYGTMVDHDATTCWEMYPNFSENRVNPNMLTRSHCHAWSAAPAYFMGSHVLGVKPDAPGWTEVIIAPQPGDLGWARGTVPLPGQGRIDVSWKRSNSHVLLVRVTAPKEIKVSFQPPDGFEGEMELISI